jgi:hypothetical protein
MTKKEQYHWQLADECTLIFRFLVHLSCTMPLCAKVLSSLLHLPNDQVSCASDGYHIWPSRPTPVDIWKCQKSTTFIAWQLVVLLGALEALPWPLISMKLSRKPHLYFPYFLSSKEDRWGSSIPFSKLGIHLYRAPPVHTSKLQWVIYTCIY